MTPPRTAAPVVVAGGGLAGMAAAARLAKAGHKVILCEAAERLGGAWAAAPLGVTHDGRDGRREVRGDKAPGVLTFPAPWRDLFRKSGRPLEAELARSGHALVPAPPPQYLFADGNELTLPAGRGEQSSALTSAYGPGIAESWQGLLDGLGEVWQALRPLGLEAELRDRRQLMRARTTLQPHRTIEDLALAVPHPHLAAVLRSLAYRQGGHPAQTPAFRAVDLAVVRTFGRWTVQELNGGDDTGRSSVLAEALIARLSLRGVEVWLGSRVAGIEVGPAAWRSRAGRGRATAVVLADGTRVPAAAVVSTVDPWQLAGTLLDARTGGWLRRRVRRLVPALAPAVSHEVVALRQTQGAGEGAGAVGETVRLTGEGVPVVTYERPVGKGLLRSSHDFTAAVPDPGAGVAWRRFGDWVRRPPVSTPVAGLYLAGPFSPAGNDPSAVLLSAALAATACHQE